MSTRVKRMGLHELSPDRYQRKITRCSDCGGVDLAQKSEDDREGYTYASNKNIGKIKRPLDRLRINGSKIIEI